MNHFLMFTQDIQGLVFKPDRNKCMKFAVDIQKCAFKTKPSVCISVCQAKESIEQLVYLCRTDKEDVRDAAKQALLVLGESE